MRRGTKVLIGSVIGVAIAASAVGVGLASSADDDDGADTALTGDALASATAAALEHTGGGEVIETETGDDGAAYGVEIRLDDGSVVEVNLDAGFAVIGSATDDDGPDGAGDED